MDLLEPMRRASELGSPDFYLCGPDVTFRLGCQLDFDLPCDSEGSESLRINRHAAAVCAEWWQQRNVELDLDWHKKTAVDGLNDAQHAHYADLLEDCRDMIDLCRAFANEHGR